MSDPVIFRRPDFVSDVATRLLKPGCFQCTDGLFITGIRRIGKTTFIRNELIPELQAQGAMVIYVDLWGNRSEPPTKTILTTVRRALADLPGTGLGIKDLKVDLKFVSFTFNVEEVGSENGVTLAQAFSELIAKINTSVVLIIDEIQETLRTNAGIDLLAALKAARDEVNLRPNNESKTYLLIVGTGSHRSLVSGMSSRPSLPFYGADRIDFPLLPDEFPQWMVSQLKEGQGATIFPSPEALIKGFRIVGSRPRIFRQILLNMQTYSGTEFDPCFLLACTQQARMEADDFLGPIKTADLTTKLIFTEIAKSGPTGCANLYSKAFLLRLSEAIGRPTMIPASSVQAKLKKMEKADWIFPVTYGSYAVSDPQASFVWLNNLDDYMQGL